MRRGMNSLAIQMQQGLKRDPRTGDLHAFRGRRGHLVKILWHDGIGMSLYARRLERGLFIRPSPADGTVAITSAQLAYMLEGIDWPNPVRSWRPEAAGGGCGSLARRLCARCGACDNPAVTTPDEIDALRAALAAERAARR
jgi:transposase